MIWWLASYPKSGNTWLRAVLHAALRGGSVDLGNLLPQGAVPTYRDVFEDELVVCSGDLDVADEFRLRPLATECHVQRRPTDMFCKTHDALVEVAPGVPVLPTSATAGAVYLVRDPRDIAGSLGHHFGLTLSAAVDTLCDEQYRLGPASGQGGPALGTFVGDWSSHVESWMKAPFPVHVARYEDLLSDPLTAFGAILAFLGRPIADCQLQDVIAATRFDVLRDRERQGGFSEAPVGRPFFRQGKAGAWRSELSEDMLARICGRHGPMMARFGYAP